MKTRQEKKEFALSQLAPYYADPTTCGYNENNQLCEYLTNEGKMCVAGKNMINPKNISFDCATIREILDEYSQEEVFKPEVVGILNDYEWLYLQRIHDSIATNKIVDMQWTINVLNLFTLEELEERANLLKKDLVD